MTLLTLMIVPSSIPCKRLSVVSGGLGPGGRQHSPDEFTTMEGLREFEKFVVSFLYKLAEGSGNPRL